LSAATRRAPQSPARPLWLRRGLHARAPAGAERRPGREHSAAGTRRPASAAAIADLAGGERPGPLSAAGQGGQDRHGIAVLDRRVGLREVANVLVLHVQVDEPAKLSILLVQRVSDTGIVRAEIAKDLFDRGSIGVHYSLSPGVRAEKGGHPYLNRHCLLQCVFSSTTPRAGDSRRGARF